MPKYRKTPVVIEAAQWHRNGDHPAACAFGTTPAGPEHRCRQCDHGWIDTLEGGHIVYPCRPAIFGATYESVDED